MKQNLDYNIEGNSMTTGTIPGQCKRIRLVYVI